MCWRRCAARADTAVDIFATRDHVNDDDTSVTRAFTGFPSLEVS
jgi:hypothetical protein